MQTPIFCRASRILKVLGLTLTVVAVSACSARETEDADGRSPSGTVSADSRVTVSDVDGLNARDALALANTWKTTEKGVTTFVDTQRISFEFADGKKTSVRLPDAKMVVAIAPYITSTHPCETHYMSGCQGEMASTTVRVYGTSADGLVVVDDAITTMANGFFELWLVRDLEIQLTVEYDGKRASQLISTKSNSNTCITTMRLS
jgi:hypothetical protein